MASGNKLSYFYLVTFGRVMKRVWYLPGRPNKVAIWDQSVFFFGILGNGKALRKMQSSALVRRSSFYYLAKG
jgi:hypothetical protein